MSCIRVKPVLRRSLRPTPRPIICCHTCNSADAHSSSLNQIQYAGTIPTSRSEVLGYKPYPRGNVTKVGSSHFLIAYVYLTICSIRFYKENDLVLKNVIKT